MRELLAALSEFPEASIVFTYPNADTGGRILIRMIDQYAAANRPRTGAFVSLGQRRYLSLMREADVVVGNSSSGITEAPALRRATVNVGGRQDGRLKAGSVIDCAADAASIAAAIRRALSAGFREGLARTASLYGAGNASAAIVARLKSDLPRVQKPFFDIDHAH